MQHLSTVDAVFLHFEAAETPMHVANLSLFELPVGYHGDYYEDVKALLAKRMHMAAIFRRKLAQMPFELADKMDWWGISACRRVLSQAEAAELIEKLQLGLKAIEALALVEPDAAASAPAVDPKAATARRAVKAPAAARKRAGAPVQA